MNPRMNRRRFLTITAAALCPLPARAQTVVWTGTGLGTALTIRLETATPATAPRLFTRIEALVQNIEATASLHRDSALTRLNRDGHLSHPSASLLALLTLADTVHTATGGAFDPTIQPLWLARANGTPCTAPIGWPLVALSQTEIRLPHGAALTLNGIAQGWAADQTAALLRAEGYENVLIDMGEIATLGPRPDGTPWTAAIHGPAGEIAHTTLTNRALATSSPRGTLIGGQPHILHPTRSPHWQTASVSAPLAALADALSTAFTLMTRPEIDATLAHFPEARLEALA